jgi:hypothetical protein
VLRLRMRRPARYKEDIDYALTYVNLIQLLCTDLRLVNSFVTKMPDEYAIRMSRAKVRNKLGDAMYIE